MPVRPRTRTLGITSFNAEAQQHLQQLQQYQQASMDLSLD